MGWLRDTQPSSPHGWTSAFLLDVHKLCGAIEGEIEPFSAKRAQDGLAKCNQPGIEPGQQAGQ